MFKRPLALLLVVGCVPVTVWSQVRVGPEFQVNTYTTSFQNAAGVALFPDGGFVVAWTSNGQDGSGQGVFARRHDAAGTPLGVEEFRVNAVTLGNQSDVDVAPLPGGSFVVVWASRQDGTYGVFGRHFDAAGSAGPEFAVNSYTTGDQFGPAIASNASDGAVAVWMSQPSPGGGVGGVFGQRYDAEGVPLGGEFQVSASVTAATGAPDVAMAADGSFVVVWTNDLVNSDIRARRYDPAGVPIAGEFTVNAAAGNHSGPTVALAPDERFVVVWRGLGAGGESIRGRRFDATSAALGAEFLVNTVTTGTRRNPEVAIDARGGFVVVWQDNLDVLGRRFDSAGSPETPEFQPSTATASLIDGKVAMDAAGEFLAAWTVGVAGDDNDVFAQRFRPDLIFRDGFEAANLGAWSATATDGGDLAASIFAAMDSTTSGLRGVVDDTAPLFVQDDSPNDERLYSARFYLDTNGFDPGEAVARFRTRVFIAFSEAPARRVAAIVLRRQGGQYSIRARARLDDNTLQDTPFIPIDDGPHAIELFLLASSGPDVNGGRLFLFIDGNFVAGHLGLDNSLAAVDFVRMGALSLKPGASGTLYWDEFESRRQTSPIGP